MGFKLSLILGGLLVATVAGLAWYIDYQADQITTLKGNQIVLETEIQKQNEFVLLKILSERCKNSFSVRLIRSINFFLYLALAKRGTHLTLKISTYAEE